MIKEYHTVELMVTDEVGTAIDATTVGVFVPGTHVTYRLNNTWRGIVISIIDGIATVLWSFNDEKLLFSINTNVSTVTATSINVNPITIQPMSLPTGSIFYIDYTYGK